MNSNSIIYKLTPTTDLLINTQLTEIYRSFTLIDCLNRFRKDIRDKYIGKKGLYTGYIGHYETNKNIFGSKSNLTI